MGDDDVCNRHLCGPQGREYSRIIPCLYLSTHTHSWAHTPRWHPLQLVIAFSTNCPQECTFNCGRQLHRLRVNMCLQEHCAGCSLGSTDMPDSVAEWRKVNSLKSEPITSSAEGPVAMLIVVLRTPCCSLHFTRRFILVWKKDFSSIAVYKTSFSTSL